MKLENVEEANKLNKERIDQIHAELEELDLIAEQSDLSTAEQELYEDLHKELELLNSQL